jgi:superfamily II DNA/RNA helicase
MNSKSIELGNIETLVLDEADRLLELGFFELITKIINMIQESSDVANR